MVERGRVARLGADLITVLDTETADAIATEWVRYGQRVTVIAIACHPVWRTEGGRPGRGRAARIRLRLRLRARGGTRWRGRLTAAWGSTSAGRTPTRILDRDNQVLAKAKVPCTPDITAGITAALGAVVHAPGVEADRITHVMLGTTHATNAVLERSRLRRVAVIRIGGPATHSIRPMYEWPRDLSDAVSVGATIVDGGIEFDGRDLAPLDTDAVARFLGQVAGQAEGLAIISVFAPVSARHELLAAELVQRELGEHMHVSLSHEIGSVGLLERENATILNAALTGVAQDVARAMQDALSGHDLRPETFFAQNDGTLMALDHAVRYPVLTIGSGRANSIRGAAFLTGSSDALVVDVGGTSTDVGVLVNQFPGIVAGRRDRRHPDELPDAGPGHGGARRRHRTVRDAR